MDWSPTHNKAHLFASFFSIFLHFFLFYPCLKTFCRFFFVFFTFLKCPPLILAQYQRYPKSHSRQFSTPIVNSQSKIVNCNAPIFNPKTQTKPRAWNGNLHRIYIKNPCNLFKSPKKYLKRKHFLLVFHFFNNSSKIQTPLIWL